MKRFLKRNVRTLLVMLVLIAAMALFMAGCAKDTGSAGAESRERTPVSFTLEVTGADGVTKHFDLRSDAETVGEALLAEGLIEGEAGDYGLYVKVVDGERADYAVDGYYWAFYVGGAYGVAGVDTTPLEEGEVYAFKAE